MIAVLVAAVVAAGVGVAWATGSTPFGDGSDRSATSPGAGEVTATATSPGATSGGATSADSPPTEVETTAPETTTPSVTVPPVRPRADPVQRDVTDTLRGYLDAINDGDYDRAMSWVSEEIRADSSREQWYADYETTYDDRLRVRRVRDTGELVRVWATFRSRQAAGYGPEGARDATCLAWSIDYEMTRAGSRYVISDAAGHGDPPWTRCD